MSQGFWTRGALKLALAALLALTPALANAKMGGGGSMGSRGSRTFSAPPPTRTAPSAAAPIERTITPPTQPRPSATPGFGQPASPLGGGFGRGLLGGLAGGLIGAGLFGLLSGHGLFGGVEGLFGFIGLLLQIGLIVLLARLAWGWWMQRNAATAGGPRPGANGGPQGPGGFAFGGLPGGGGGAQAQAPQSAPLKPTAEDFNAFERLLTQTQDAYSREDMSALARLTTAEMARYFGEEIAANRAKGVINRISGVKLLQGDLSEAWREGGDEYATVAMRFALTDAYVDAATGQPKEPAQTSESRELWTFRRRAGAGPDGWALSAIQQAA